MNVAAIGAIWGLIKEFLYGRGIIKDPKEEAEYKRALLEFAITEENAFARVLEAVNATMQAEAKSEHWAQWAWRPTVGFTFSGTIAYNYILRPLIAQFSGNTLPPIEIPGEVWNTMLMVLGVAAATRGWQKIEQARNGKQPISPNAPQTPSGQNAVPRPVVDNPDEGLRNPGRVTEFDGKREPV